MSTDKAMERRRRRARRHARIQKKIRGTERQPRLVVFRSLKHIEGQLVDDDRGVTLAGASSQGAEVDDRVPDELEERVAESFAAGRLLAERAQEVGIDRVVFDRAGYPYHGRVKAFAEGARAGGLEF